MHLRRKETSTNCSIFSMNSRPLMCPIRVQKRDASYTHTITPLADENSVVESIFYYVMVVVLTSPSITKTNRHSFNSLSMPYVILFPYHVPNLLNAGRLKFHVQISLTGSRYITFIF